MLQATCTQKMASSDARRASSTHAVKSPAPCSQVQHALLWGHPCPTQYYPKIGIVLQCAFPANMASGEVQLAQFSKKASKNTHTHTVQQCKQEKADSQQSMNL